MNSSVNRTKVWDLPLRLFHWSLVLVFASLWYTGENADLERHFLLGNIMLGLLVFRLLWGIVGSHTARFNKMPLHPTSAFRYLKGQYGDSVGHNPIGSWSVILILTLLTLQVMTGLFANDGVMDEGPLAQFISTDLSDELTRLHHQIFDIMLIVLGTHIAAAFFYQFFKKQRLIEAMIHGKKSLSANTEPPAMAHPVIAVICIVLAIMISWSVYNL